MAILFILHRQKIAYSFGCSQDLTLNLRKGVGLGFEALCMHSKIPTFLKKGILDRVDILNNFASFDAN